MSFRKKAKPSRPASASSREVSPGTARLVSSRGAAPRQVAARLAFTIVLCCRDQMSPNLALRGFAPLENLIFIIEVKLYK